MIPRNLDRQRGAVLLVSLVMLVLVTLIGVASMQTSNMEVVMATNSQARTTALSDAENALVDGESDILINYPGVPLFDWTADTSDGLYTVGDIVGSVVNVVVWTDVAGAYEAAPTGGQYTTEYLGPYTTSGASLTMGAGGGADRRYLYRVTGRGVFGDGGTRFVQSIFATQD
jgi:type IV pilus assembly protein PilX